MGTPYSPPCEHVIINTSTGSLPIKIGTCISLAELKASVATSTGCDPLALRLFKELGHDELLDERQLIPSGAILQLVGGPILSQVTRRRDRRGQASAELQEPLPLTAMFACGFIGSIPQARQRLETLQGFIPDAQMQLGMFQGFSESRDLQVGALISLVGAVSAWAKRSAWNRSRTLPRLQVRRAAPENILAGSDTCLACPD